MLRASHHPPPRRSWVKGHEVRYAGAAMIRNPLRICTAVLAALQWHMPALTREKKITFGEMRCMGVRGVLIYCSDHKCSHSIAISTDQRSDHVRIRSSGTDSAGAGASSTARSRLAGDARLESTMATMGPPENGRRCNTFELSLA